MKKEKRILNVLGQVDEKYVAEAAPDKSGNKNPTWIKWVSIAACFAVLVAVILPFVQNDTGAPPPNKDDFPPASTQEPCPVIPPATINANGLHLVQLSYAAPVTTEFTTDFIIHVNPNVYVSREENGTYVIRPTTPTDEGIPECSLQIFRVSDATPAATAERIRTTLTESYLNVGDIGVSTVTDGLFIHADNGNTWNAEQVDVTITDDLSGGSYVLAASYFTEATEGHGVRFADMVGTFKAVTSDDTAAMPVYLAELNRTISAFAPAFFTDTISEINDIVAHDALICTYEADVMNDVSIACVDYSISGDENPMAAVVSVKHRINTEDSYNYLTIELTYNADGKWVVNFAGIEK